MKIEGLPTSNHGLTLEEAIQDFLLHQRASRHSTRTIENHELALSKLKDWAQKNQLSFLSEFDASVLRRFMVAVHETRTPRGDLPKASTVHTIHKNVKAFFCHHEAEENIPKNPMKRVKPPKLDLEILPAFTEAEVRTLEAATNGKDARSVRNRALVYFLLDTGCRLQELVSLSTNDVNTETGTVMVRKGKGGKDRLTRIGFKAQKALNAYLRTRPKIGVNNLWLGQQGPLTCEGVATILEKLGRSCGVHCNPHKFRRTTALTMLRNGCDVYSIKALLGHSDLQVLQRYLAQTQADITKAHQLYSPVDNL